MSDKGFIMQPDGDIVFVTVSKYRMFYAHGEAGMDALHLYLHLIFTCRLQFTNTVKAHNIYLQKGLHWGKERTLKAKNLLFEFDLIKQIERKNSKGQFEGTYIIVKTTTSPFELKEYTLAEVSGGLETGGLETADRQEETNALTNNINALTNKEIPLESKEEKTLIRRSDLFELFWRKYGKPVGKQNTIKQWNKRNEADRINILNSVENYTDFRKDVKFRKDPERYIRDGIFNDFITPATNAFKEYGTTIDKPKFREIGDKL